MADIEVEEKRKACERLIKEIDQHLADERLRQRLPEIRDQLERMANSDRGIEWQFVSLVVFEMELNKLLTAAKASSRKPLMIDLNHGH